MYYKFLEMTSNFGRIFHYLVCRTTDITQPAFHMSPVTTKTTWKFLTFLVFILNYRHIHHIKVSVLVTLERPQPSEVLCDYRCYL